MNNRNSFQFLSELSKKEKALRLSLKDSGGAAFLGFLIDKKKYYLPVGQIREIIPNPNVVPIGHGRSWLSGLIKSQGEIYSVVDAGIFVGDSDVPIESRKGIAITLSVDEGNYALLVSAILGITKVTKLQHMEADDFSVTYRTVGKELIPAISIASILESKKISNMSIF